MPSNTTDVEFPTSAIIGTADHSKSIVIADRNPLLAEVLSNHLNKRRGMRCSHVANDSNMCAEIARLLPDVFVIDPSHLETSTTSNIRSFSEKVLIAHPDTKILGYSFDVSSVTVKAAIEAGFRGCISKNAQLEDLEAALTVVLAGGICFDKAFGSQLQPLLTHTGDDDPLSEREKEVLIGFAKGLSAKQIAYELNISSKTVDTYKARAVQKLGLSDRSKLVTYVIRQGWLE